jgi:hypothetical protein
MACARTRHSWDSRCWRHWKPNCQPQRQRRDSDNRRSEKFNIRMQVGGTLRPAGRGDSNALGEGKGRVGMAVSTRIFCLDGTDGWHYLFSNTAPGTHAASYCLPLLSLCYCIRVQPGLVCTPPMCGARRSSTPLRAQVDACPHACQTYIDTDIH